MANNLDAFNPEYRSARTQRLLKTQLIAREIASFEEQSTLRDGDMVHRPYYSDVTIHNYTKGQDVTVQDVTATDEYLEVKTSKEATVYIDEIDVKQNKYDTANKYIDRMTYALKKDIDGALLKEVLSAAIKFDDADSTGGTAGNPISFDASNAFKNFSLIEAKMNANDIEDTKSWFAVITPAMKAALQQSSLANGFNQADAALRGILKGVGYLGTWGNFNIMVSNNVAHTTKLTGVTTAGTITINGATITTKSSPSAAGDCKNTAAAIIACVNGEVSADYKELDPENRAKLTACGAKAILDGSDVVIVTNGNVAVSATGAAAGTKVAHCWFGQYGCTDMVIQKDVTIQKNKEPKKTGYNYLCYTLYGIKTFKEGRERCVDVLIAA